MQTSKTGYDGKGDSMNENYQAIYEEILLGRVYHIAIVVKDMDKAIDIMSAIGIHPEPPSSRAPRETTMHGQVVDFTGKVKLTKMYMGNVGLEIFQPLSGDTETPYGQFLEKTGGGIHHYCFIVKNLEKAVEEMVKKGARVISTCRELSRSTPHAYYLQIEALPGIFIELLPEDHPTFPVK
jgi:methylmalonyl-CoA/ethylmalonyl-CoA epimerase